MRSATHRARFWKPVWKEEDPPGIGRKLTGQGQLPVRAPFPLAAPTTPRLTLLTCCFTPPSPSPGVASWALQPSNGAAWDRGRIPLLQQTHPSRRARRSLIKIFLFSFSHHGCFLCSRDTPPHTTMTTARGWARDEHPADGIVSVGPGPTKQPGLTNPMDGGRVSSTLVHPPERTHGIRFFCVPNTAKARILGKPGVG